ncbi:LTA synthase family protein [Paenibacillus sp. YK5]
MRPLASRGQPKSSRLAQARAIQNKVILVSLLTVPFLLVFGMELIQRGNVQETWDWLTANPKLFAVNALLAFFVFLLIYCLIGSLFFAMGFSTLLLMLMSLISFFKQKLIGEPFFPWDIFLKKESMNIIPLVTSKEALVRLVLVLGISAGIFLLRIWLPRWPMKLWVRMTLGLMAVLALYSFGVRAPWAEKVMAQAGANEIVWNQQQNYGENGISLAFTMNVRNSIVPKPSGYSELSIANMAEGLNELVGASKASASNDKKPNVIFIMNEAFWDPTLLPGVKFNKDPLPTVHRLQKKTTSGYLLSPQFGGGTSNVEFEVLTGQSMSNLPAGSIPYQQYIRKPIPSLASYFKNQGYRSVAIHSYDGWFWNREEVYQYMGFDDFKSKEDFDNPEYRGAFISDDEVSRSIIDEVEANDNPTFIYAVTMENHGPYNDNRYGETDIKVEGNLTEEARNTLQTYAQGVYNADHSLKMLIDHFEKSDEPTVIVFYGDHLPMLGYDYDVYVQSGFVSTGRSDQWSLEEQKRIHSVPFVMWSNMDLPKEHVPILSNSFLNAYVLDRLQMEKPAAWAYNFELSRKVPGLLRGLVVDSGQVLYTSPPSSVASDVEKYRELQYDEMFGGQYLAKYLDSNGFTRSDEQPDGFDHVNIASEEEVDAAQ